MITLALMAMIIQNFEVRFAELHQQAHGIKRIFPTSQATQGKNRHDQTIQRNVLVEHLCMFVNLRLWILGNLSA